MEKHLRLLLFFLAPFLVNAQTDGNISQSNNIALAWSFTPKHYGLDTRQVLELAPHFPVTSIGAETIGTWLKTFPGEAEALVSSFESISGNTIARPPLGMALKPVRYEQIVPYWSNAVATYGSDSEIFSNLPNIPNPKDFCPVEGYVNDNNLFSSWRDKYGYGPVGDSLLLLDREKLQPGELMYSPGDLFDSEKYPCLGNYYNAADKWIYEFPAEYEKLMNECDCGGGNTETDFQFGKMDNQKPYVPYSERIAYDPKEALESDDGLQVVATTINNPIKVVFNDGLLVRNGLSNFEDLRDLSNSDFCSSMSTSFPEEQLKMLFASTIVWSLSNADSEWIVQKISACPMVNGTDEFISLIEQGQIKAEKVVDREFLSRLSNAEKNK